jgi:hypothetical protein
MDSRRWVSRVRIPRRRRPRAYIPSVLRLARAGLNRTAHAQPSTERERASIKAIPKDD